MLPVLVLPLGLTLLLLLQALLTPRRGPLLLAFALLYTSSTPRVGRALIRAVVGDEVHGSLAAGVAAEADAVALGVRRERILTTGPVRTTAEEAVAVATLLRETLELGGEAPHVLLVTSAFHQPRAVALFERQGLRVTPYPVDLRVDAARIATLRDLLPSARALLDAETALREWLGQAVYRVAW